MEKLSAKVKRPLWVAGLNIALALTVGSTQAFAGNISTVAGLLEVTGESNYLLTRNLDLANVTPSDSAAYITSTFTGTFDGGGFIISGLTKPLFDEIGGDEISSEISNLTLIADESTGVSGRGILANATLIGTEIVNVHGVGDVDGGVSSNVGGLVGTLGTGEISESSFTGDVTGTDTVGGLVGLAFGDISDSTFSGEVRGERYVGGLVGGTGAPTISNSSASGTVTGINGGEGNIGGLVGGGSLTINNSHADVTVIGGNQNQNVGGLLGYGDASVSISHSYSTGTVSGDINVGGLVGRINGGLISESYSTATINSGIQTSDENNNCLTYCAIENFGGLVGRSGIANWGGEIRGVRAGEDGGIFVTTATLIDYSYATGEVTISGDQSNDGTGVGGLVGYSEGTIMNSFASGNVNAGTNVGGLVGELGAYSINPNLFVVNPDFDGTNQLFLNFINENGLIKNSYATGGVNGVNYVGGLVGNSSGTITNSYANIDGDVIGTEQNVGGLAGYAQDITNSYAIVSGDVIGDQRVGGLTGEATTISNSYAIVGGDVIGTNAWGSAQPNGGITSGLVGGLVGGAVNVSNSYTVVGGSVDATALDWYTNPVGGLVGQSYGGIIDNSYASIGLDVASKSISGGLVGYTLSTITNSRVTVGGNIVGDYAGGLVGIVRSENTGAEISNSNSSVTGNIVGDFAGGLVGSVDTVGMAAEISNSNSSVTGNITGVSGAGDLVGYAPVGTTISGSIGTVNGEALGITPLAANELLAILNTGYVSPVFALDPAINGGRPYLLSHLPPSEDNGDEDNGNEQVSPRFNFSFLPTQALDGLSKSVGFEVTKSDLSKLDLALLDPIKDDMSAQITGAKLFANQSLSTSLSVGSLLQLEINYEANKSVQMWVKSSDGQYVLVGDIRFDKDGNAVLPGIEFKKSGQYEIIFVNSDKKDLTQPELINKVSGLTVYVN